ncbi:dihydrolipoamide acetyltransferase family protein [Auraticoccus monumenti]|uniref:Dihydrolipoamide acetyltransferase component of pyruvate dehydrogenase complex n=1 Tax=Auraticoccus monumenti TaxID=675864 RepID=A0A1G7A1J5_9ACTN|nr:dihydrolipoamide acetyltransferase family protein [Auraticoccus monumenti]SDE08503.1 pyruvate dehydrogenase E2 component (dihydrolipoamide acetyltransferase) [Auraticoccus monumenti]
MIDILMPRLSDTMTEGTIAAWHKKPGDPVQPGDVLLEIETDKALMEQEAYDAGTLVEILVAEGGQVEIGTPIARLDDGIDHGVDPGAPTPPAAAEVTQTPPGDDPDPTSRRLFATPLVRRLARENDIDLSTITGTGPNGRIVRADLAAAAATPADAPEDEAPGDGAPGDGAPGDGAPGDGAPVPPHAPDPAPTTAADRAEDERAPRRTPFDPVRRAVASRLTESATIPTFTVTVSADVGALLGLRQQVNAAQADGGIKVSVNDLVVRAVATALRAHPGLNASYDPAGGGATLMHDRVHIGMAVASPAGLVVPVIRDADRASVTTIAHAARDLVTRATERRLTAGDMSGGTFTVSNLGMFGVDHFTAIINPPQGAILAVGGVHEELVLVDGEPGSRQTMSVTLTSDHRIIDGAAAARFLATLVQLLESPLRVLS